MMAHAQKPDFVFQRNGRVYLSRRRNHFSRLLAVEQWGSAGRPWIDNASRYSARVVATLSNRLFPLHFPSHASPCAITFQRPLPIVQEAGWVPGPVWTVENLAPPGLDPRAVQPVAQSLYLLSYRAHAWLKVFNKIIQIH